MEQQYIDHFFDQCISQGEVWLLQADDGMFAMVEDADGMSILPMYATKSEAQASAIDEWSDYKPEPMPMRELIQWLTEMSDDDMYVGIAAGGNKVIPYPASIMQQELILRRQNR
ncbi:MAG: DUF2750 domain-containing protein [Bacteroidetes bacterium]|nr:DUF2750 domain-containing protein [Bacteroidota bacterium]